MTGRKAVTRGRKLMLRLPRPVRVILGMWMLGVMLAPMLIALAALALLPLGAPHSINAGPAWEYVSQIFAGASLVAATPLAVFVGVTSGPAIPARDPRSLVKPRKRLRWLPRACSGRRSRLHC